MTRIGRPWLVVALLSLVLVLGAALVALRVATGQRARVITVTIKRIDPAARRAVVELTHPKTGQTLEIEGSVPPECDIQIDGRPARLDELRAGEMATVEAVMGRDASLSANWVRVTRAPGPPASRPATTDAPPRP